MANLFFLPLAVLVVFTGGCSALVGFTVSPLSVSEDVGVAVFTITPDTAGAVWLFTYKTVDDTAVGGTDFTAVTTTSTDVKFSSDSSVDISVNITEIAGYQGNRIFKLSFPTGTGTGVPDNQEVSITIMETDFPPVAYSVANNSPVTEGGNNLRLILTRTDGTTYAFDVEVSTTSDSATSDQDFENLTAAMLTFPADTDVLQIEIGIMDDDEAESTESFGVSIGGAASVNQYMITVELQDNDTPVMFHCGRRGQECKDQSQCKEDGRCTPCETGYSGADCTILDVSINTPACDPACVNGTCVSGECKCDPGFTGATCEYKAYFHQCNPTNLTVCVTPYGNFAGKIYVIGNETEPACNLEKVSDPVPEGVVDWCEGYAAVIPYDGVCGMLGPTAVGSGTKYEVMLTARYNPPQIRHSDEIVTFTCFYSNSSVIVSGHSFSLAAPQLGEGTGTPNGGTENFSPAVQTATLTSGDPIPALLELGTRIKICPSVENVPGYAAVLVRSVIVDNGRDPPNNQSEVAFENGCPLNAILTRSPYFDPENETYKMCYTLDSFILDPSDTEPKIRITSVVEVYEDDTNAEAVMDPCVDRKKRDTTSTGGNMQRGYSQTVIRLTRGGADTGTPNGGDALVEEPRLTDTECERKWLMPSLIGVGVVAITMAIIIAIMGFTIAKQFKAKRFD